MGCKTFPNHVLILLGIRLVSRWNAFEPNKPKADLPGIQIQEDLAKALDNVDGIILLVNHKELREISPQKMAALTSCRILIDTVNGWQGQEWKDSGFNISKLGVNR